LAETRREEVLSARLLIILEGHENYFGSLNKSSGKAVRHHPTNSLQIDILSFS
jgi:hypothetical protein